MLKLLKAGPAASPTWSRPSTPTANCTRSWSKRRGWQVHAHLLKLKSEGKVTGTSVKSAWKLGDVIPRQSFVEVAARRWAAPGVGTPGRVVVPAGWFGTCAGAGSSGAEGRLRITTKGRSFVPIRDAHASFGSGQGWRRWRIVPTRWASRRRPRGGLEQPHGQGRRVRLPVEGHPEGAAGPRSTSTTPASRTT